MIYNSREEFKKVFVEEMRKTLPCLELEVCGDNFDKIIIKNSDGKELNLDNSGCFNSSKETLMVECSAFTHFMLSYVNKKNLTQILYDRDPITDFNLFNSQDRVRIYKYFTDTDWFEIDIKTESSLGNNLLTNIGIYTCSGNSVRNSWGCIGIIHNGSSSEIYNALSNEIDSIHKDVNSIINRIRELLLEAINFIISNSILIEKDFDGVEDAINKSLSLITSGMSELIVKKKKRLIELGKPVE